MNDESIVIDDASTVIDTGECEDAKKWRIKWSTVHQRLLESVCREFGHDRQMVRKLFPGFSQRLLFRKMGEIKAAIEKNEWLPKHDQVIIKGIVKGVTAWSKIAKRYLPRKSLAEVKERADFLKYRLGFKMSVDICGSSTAKQGDCDDSFQSTRHTEMTIEEKQHVRETVLPIKKLEAEMALLRVEIPKSPTAFNREADDQDPDDDLRFCLEQISRKVSDSDKQEWNDNLQPLDEEFGCLLPEIDLGISVD